MRYVLALGVLIAHYNSLAGHSVFYFLSSYDCVGAFFALSGFLVYPSFEKVLNFRSYCLSRARRIMPPYVFIVLLCAFGLVFASSLPANDYFASARFWKYLVANLCFLNWLQPDLPGVFCGQEYALPAVNGSLWTMKVEWCLYFSVPIVVWLVKSFRLNRKQVAVAVILLSMLYRWGLLMLFDSTGKEIYEILARQFCGQLAYFYSGVLIYFYKEQFRRNLVKMCCLGLVLFLAAHYVPFGSIFFSPVGVSVLVLGISLIGPTPGILRHRHNVSYEMYLFHFPIIQLLIFTGVNELPTYVSFPALLLATVGLAALCHFYVCLPFMKKKNRHHRNESTSAKL